jgi:hypothetical protein
MQFGELAPPLAKLVVGPVRPYPSKTWVFKQPVNPYSLRNSTEERSTSGQEMPIGSRGKRPAPKWLSCTDFLSLDADLRLTYLNDAACAELKVDRQTALHDTISHAAPRCFSESILTELQAASLRNVPTFFEAQSELHSIWYDLRCFPGLCRRVLTPY